MDGSLPGSSVHGILQDGGIGGHRTHLPQQTHQKYTHMSNNSHEKLNRDWQKGSCTIKAIRKIYVYQVGGGRDEIRSEPVPLGRDSEEKRDYIGGDAPWEVSGSSHILSAPALGSDKEKTNPLGWSKGLWTNKRTVENRDSGQEEHANTCFFALFLSKAKKADRNHVSG